MQAAKAEQPQMSEADFQTLLTLVRDLTGITMTDAKRQLVERRVNACMKGAGIRSFSEYIGILKSGDAVEVERFSNAVTTNLTSFFRENHHFDFLANTVLADKRKKNSKHLRIWSAGCSTGEEPYSIAMTLRENVPGIDSWDSKVLCTDIDSEVMRTATNGVYPESRFEKVSDERRSRWFLRGVSGGQTFLKAKPDLQKLLSFSRLNLMDPWPFKGKFDVIFCRNVVIYFDKPTQKKLVERYAEYLADDGYLILGHSESLHKVSDRFDLLGKTIYKKIR